MAQRLRAGDAGREKEEDEEPQGAGRGRWKRRARGGKASASSRQRTTATVRRRMMHSEDQVRGSVWGLWFAWLRRLTRAAGLGAVQSVQLRGYLQRQYLLMRR